MNDEIRREHAIMEYNDEIRYCKSVLSDPKASKADKDGATQRLNTADAELKNLKVKL